MKSLLILSALIATTSAAAQPVEVITDAPRIERVAFVDLDLTSDAGVRRLEARIHSAANRLCIDDEPGDRRFAISATYETVQGAGAAGDARATSLSELGIRAGGILSFFNVTNPELLVKVLDGCALNNHYWVFFAATTNVGFELVVEDTVAQTERRYTNDDLRTAAPVTDTSAFPCQ